MPGYDGLCSLRSPERFVAGEEGPASREFPKDIGQELKRMRKKVFDGGFSAVAFAGAEARR